ncbi:MAG TPA: asparagine synthetase B, partial [Burkholderiaceae bacterium]|nr:asparagine synthetase B [Burkholderiaceae bacterium]
MCGIAGFIGQRWVAEPTWQQMLDALAPRGPDARRAQIWNAQFVAAEGKAQAALLHTRLSIRDLRTVAHQPMASAAGDVWISFNGEVYGWEREAQELRRRGYTFNTTSDTEFILHGYTEWGLDVLPKLRGKFALAILDLRSRKLYLIRDRLGIKPLVYFHRPGELAFGSTVRAVLPYLAAEERRVSPEAIDAYLAHRYIPAPRTIFENLRRLPPAHYAAFDIARGTLEVTRYWQPQSGPGDFAATLIESVELRTVSDRPIGLFLSGGIDSTTI